MVGARFMVAFVERDFQLHAYTGQSLEPWLEALGELRIRVFREYPYLYDGSAAYEREYLRRYLDARDSLVVVVSDRSGRAVGATTCLPMREEGPEFKQPFLDAGMAVDEWFYFGESVLLPEWRGCGIGKAFFDLREAHARRLGYRLTTFCAVDRPAEHPARPANYRPLDGFWHARGYRPQPHLKARFPWKEIGESSESEKSLTFWIRAAEA